MHNPLRALATARPWRGILAGILVLSTQPSSTAPADIKTPFQLVPLWTREMVEHLAGERPPACSGGATGVNCQRLNTGTCDGTAYFAHLSKTVLPRLTAPPWAPMSQTDAVKPLSFTLQLSNAGHSANLHHYWFDTLDALEVVFRCEAGDCAAARLQIGAVKRIELGALDGRKPIDVTSVAKVLPEARLRVPIDAAVKAALSDPRTVYLIRAVAECFTVASQPVEWTIPAFASPSSDGTPLGTIVIRLLPGTNALEFVYQPKSGKGIPFEPDWAQPDWGYTYHMEQTFLDRKGDWFQLPARPFPSPVWVHLPGREEIFRVERGTVYTLSKTVKARAKETNKPTVFRGGELLVIGVNGRTLELRKEEEFDSACSDAYDPARSGRQPTYLADVEEFYDGDLHLQLRPANPKGC